MKAVGKLIIIYVLRFIMHIFYFFPIKQNRIVINSYTGNQYACNPKYISEYLADKYKEQYEIIWAFRNPEKFRYLETEFGYKLVKYNSLKRFFYEATARVSINNIGSFSWFPIRIGQEHINTWHGSVGLKKCGLGEKNNDVLMKKTIQMSSDNTTTMLATSSKYIKYVCEDDLGYHGKILKCGYPRNDIIFDSLRGNFNIADKVKEFFSIPDDSYVVLYAPTWRYDTRSKLETPDFLKMKEILKKKFGRKVIVLFRIHHLSQYEGESNPFIFDATSYDDMQELLCCADLLITDYSSSLWDFALTERPILLYTPDLDFYNNNRGFHEDIYKWGFPVCRNNNDFIKSLENIQPDICRTQDRKFLQESGSFENGNASQYVGEYIFKVCNNKM